MSTDRRQRAAVPVLLLLLAAAGCATPPGDPTARPEERVVYQRDDGGLTSSTAWALDDAKIFLRAQGLDWGRARRIVNRGGVFWINFDAPESPGPGGPRVLIWSNPGKVTRPDHAALGTVAPPTPRTGGERPSP